MSMSGLKVIAQLAGFIKKDAVGSDEKKDDLLSGKEVDVLLKEFQAAIKQKIAGDEKAINENVDEVDFISEDYSYFRTKTQKLKLLREILAKLTKDPNNPELLYRAGRIYGDLLDYKNSYKYLSQAAEYKHPAAQLAFGELLYDCYGLPEDERELRQKQACALIEAAAQAKNGASAIFLARVNSEPKLVHEYCEHAISCSDTLRGYATRGEFQLLGIGGYEKNEHEGLADLVNGIRQGCPYSLMKLGKYLQNKENKRKCLELSAKYTNALNELIRLYKESSHLEDRVKADRYQFCCILIDRIFIPSLNIQTEFERFHRDKPEIKSLFYFLARGLDAVDVLFNEHTNDVLQLLQTPSSKSDIAPLFHELLQDYIIDLLEQAILTEGFSTHAEFSEVLKAARLRREEAFEAEVQSKPVNPYTLHY